MSANEHLSSQIRDALERTLRGLPGIGESVHAHRLGPLALDEVPGIVIADLGESADAITLHAPNVSRCDMEIGIRIYDRDGEAVARALGRHRYQVQKALADTTLGGLVALIRYTGQSPIDDDTLDPATRGVEMRYQAIYTVADADPDTLV